MNPKTNHPRRINSHVQTGDCDCDCACSIDKNGSVTQALPTIYSLELTPMCNNRCAGCSNVFFEDKARRKLPKIPQTFARWQEILQKIAPYASKLKITGGEPTFHPDFEAILHEIDRLEMVYTLFTNARWKNPSQTVDFLRTSHMFSGLLVSLHGATSEAHEAFTGVRGSFKQTLTNIKLAVNAGLLVNISCVLTKQNAKQIQDIVDLSKNLGASATVFNRYIGTTTNISLNPIELAQVIRTVDGFCHTEAVRFGTCIPLCFVESASTGCLAGTAYCTIDPWGNMRPCNHSPYVTGNILTGSLADAWHSDVMNKWRALTSNECTSCSYFSKCRGGCKADAVLNDIERDPLMHAVFLPIVRNR